LSAGKTGHLGAVGSRSALAEDAQSRATLQIRRAFTRRAG
jgi:hypothetical protein